MKNTKEIFVGRNEQLDLFERMITSEETPWLLLITSGGGVGKTQLLNQMSHKAKKLGWNVPDIVDFYDLVNQQKLGLLMTLRNRFKPTYFGSFKRAVDRYDRLITENERFAEKADEQAARAIIERAESQAITAFMNAFEKQMEDQPQVILFDTFELVAETELGAWFLFEMLPQLNKNAIFVIAGRRVPELQQRFQNDREVWFSALPTLNSQEVQVYFEKAGVSVEGDFVDQIVEQSDGKPLFLALTVDWLREDYRQDELTSTSKDSKQFEKLLITRINKLQNQEDLTIMAMAHIYHRFDKDVLSYLFSSKQLKGQKPSEIIDRLSRFSFVKYRPESGSCLLHDEMRDLVSEYVLDNDTTQMLRQEFSQAVLAYYEDKLSEARKGKKRNQREEDALVLEQFYHRFYSDLENALSDFWKTLDDLWHNYRYDMMSTLLQVAEDVNKKLPAPNEVLDQMIKAGRAWTFLEMRLTDKALALAKEVVDNPTGIQRIRATSLVSLGTALGYQAQYRKAEQYLFEAKEIYDDLYDKLSSDEALPEEYGVATLEGVRPERYNIFNTLGFFARQRGLFDEAFNYYSQTLKLSQQESDDAWTASALGSLAHIHRWKGEYQTAYDYAFKSLNLRRKLGDKGREAFSWNYLGMIYLNDSDFRESRKCFEKAEALWDEVGAEWDKAKALRNLGSLNYQEEQYRQARQYYTRSRHIFLKRDMRNELPDLYHKIGQLEYTLENIPQAQLTFERGLKLAREFENKLFIANYLVGLSQIAYDEHRWEQIPIFEQEVRAIETEGYSFNLAYADLEFVLGNLAYNKDQIDEAFVHYRKAYAYLGRYNDHSLKRELGFLRTKLLDLHPDQQKRQALQLIEFWQGEKDLKERYGYFVEMCQRLAL